MVFYTCTVFKNCISNVVVSVSAGNDVEGNVKLQLPDSIGDRTGHPVLVIDKLKGYLGWDFP